MTNRIKGIQPVILAGGESSRMGYNKSLATLGNKRLIEQVMNKVDRLFFATPFLVTNTPDEYAFTGLPMTGDLMKGVGPLGGIHAALHYSRLEYIFAFACDMPFVSRELVCHLAGRAKGNDVVVPVRGQCFEPLCAIYSKRCLPAIEEALRRGDRKIIAFFTSVRVTAVEVETMGAFVAPDTFRNINTPDDLEIARVGWSVHEAERGRRAGVKIDLG